MGVFFGALSGVLAALWLGAYVLHLYPNLTLNINWWGIPTFVTMVLLGIGITVVCAFVGDAIEILSRRKRK